MKMENELENKAGAMAPFSSRRQFIRAAAITGGAGLLAAGPLQIEAQRSAEKASLLVLPAATEEVKPFTVHVPEPARNDLKRR